MLATSTLSRAEILARINELEQEISELRASLPPAVKMFYRFRVIKPVQSKCLVYAGSREEAENKIFSRLANEYGIENFKLHSAVDVFDCETASLNCSTGSSLLSGLLPNEAREFISDYRAEHKSFGKRLSQLERDINEWEARELALSRS